MQFERAGDSRNALYAKIGRLRSEWESMSFPEVSEYLATELESPLVQNDPQLRLWILDAKGTVDLEVNVASARQVYEEARELAGKLGDKAREARASGELGIIAFLDGGTGDAMQLLAEALRTSIELKDVGAHIRYLNLMGNGLTLFGRPEDAIRYYDRALQLVRSTPELDTSVMAVAGKAKALIALNKRPEAEKLFQETLDRARLRNRRGLAASILTELGKVSSQAGERTRAIEFYEEAAALAPAANSTVSRRWRCSVWPSYTETRATSKKRKTERPKALRRVKRLERPTNCRSGWRSWRDSGLTAANSKNRIGFMSRRKTLSTDY